MMDKIRKGAAWCWETKERLVVAIMVILLGYRVYSLVYTNEAEEDIAKVRPPKTVYSKEIDGPPPIPPPFEIDPVTRLERKRLFQYVTPRGGSTRNQSDGGLEEGEIRVLRIVSDGSGGYKAQITTGASRKLIPEGEKFESYQLMTIDADTGCCEIYSESLGRLIEVCAEEN